MNNTEKRICNTCNQKLNITKFGKTGGGKYRNRICRSCQHKKNKPNPRYAMSRMLSQAELRCTNPKRNSYPRYGGRGIKFMLEDREEFYAKFEKIVSLYLSIGGKPSIDRIDSDGHYEMNNVQIIPNPLNTAKMRAASKVTFKQKRISKERALRKICNVCNQNIPTKKYYIRKRHKDGTVSRYDTCPSCEQIKRTQRYSKKPYYKGRVK